MDANTPVTELARRISKRANATSSRAKLWIDADGDVVATASADMYAPGGVRGAVIAVTGRAGGARRLGGWMTPREAQDRLDADAAGMDASYYLGMVEIERGTTSR